MALSKFDQHKDAHSKISLIIIWSHSFCYHLLCLYLNTRKRILYTVDKCFIHLKKRRRRRRKNRQWTNKQISFLSGFIFANDFTTKISSFFSLFYLSIRLLLVVTNIFIQIAKLKQNKKEINKSIRFFFVHVNTI